MKNQNMTEGVLILNSYHPGHLWSDREQSGVIEAIQKENPGIPINVEYLDAKKYSGRQLYGHLSELFDHKYSLKNLQLIVTLDNPAFEYYFSEHQKIFKKMPMVFGGVNGFHPKQLAPELKNHVFFTGASESIDVLGTVQLVLGLHPQTRQLFFISDDTISGRETKREVEDVVSQFPPEIKVSFAENIPFSELLDQVKQLSDSTVGIVLSYSVDAEGKYYSVSKLSESLQQAAKIPFYAVHEERVGNGIVGGSVIGGFIHGTHVGEMANQVLKGQKPSEIPFKLTLDPYFLFDYPELKKFNISLSKLPKDSKILHQPQNFYRANKLAVQLGVFLLLLALGGVFSLALNIHKRKRAEKNLRESEYRFRAVFDRAGIGIVLTDSEGKVLSVNPAHEDLVGLSRKDLEGNPFTQWIHPEDRDRVVRLMQNLIQNREFIYRSEIRGLRKNGDIYWSALSATIIQDALGKVQFCVWMLQDITEQKYNQKALVAARELALEASNAKSEFLANISHEIRTPMNVVLGMAEILSETSLSFEQRRTVETLRQAGDALLSLVNDVLDLSRIETGSLDLESKNFDLLQMIQNTCELMTTKASEKKITLHSEIAPTIGSHWVGDGPRIRQVLINLLNNAIKFTHEGEVQLTLSIEKNETQRAWLRFGVKDTGIGIPKEKLADLFVRFNQLDSGITKKYGGTGLGLSISKQLVERMEGRIWVESELGKGAAFYFVIPLVRGEVQENHVEEYTKKSVVVPRSLKILIVDDSEDNRTVLERYFQKQPFALDFAENGKEALDKFQKNIYDIILMDMQMPVLDGYSATRQIRLWETQQEGRTRTPVIALTAYALEEEIQKSKDAGCDAHVSKPIKKQILIEAICQLTGGSCG